jgi:hypothetical protein
MQASEQAIMESIESFEPVVFRGKVLEVRLQLIRGPRLTYSLTSYSLTHSLTGSSDAVR